MTIIYEFNEDERYLLCKVDGTLTLSDVKSHFQNVANDPEINSPFFEIGDFSAAKDFNFGYFQSSEIISKLKHLKSLGNYQGTLFIVDKDLILGMSNMFDVVGQHSGITIKGVNSFEEATDYIKSHFS